jgi:hypothetical protein
MARIRVFGDPPTGAEWMCALCKTPPGEGVPIPNNRTNPSPNGGNPTTTGGTMTTATAPVEIHVNEDARNAFSNVQAAADKLAEAARLAEEARAEIKANANAAQDGMGAKKFDAGATTAMADISDIVGDDTLSKWCEAADAIRGSADTGKQSLDKWLDSENLVASEGIDPSTLASTSS